jgi:hypothetical protein
MVQNKPTSPGAADTAWTTPEATWHSPVVGLREYGHVDTPGGQPIAMAGSPGPQGDDVSSSVAGSVLAAEARFASHQQDTYAQGSQIGTPMVLPDVPTAHSKHVGGDGAGYASG